MSVDDSFRKFWIESQRENATLQSQLAHSGGGTQPPGMELEIALLKQRADQTDQRLERIEGKLDRITDMLGSVATKEDVREAKRAAWQGLGVGSAIAFAVVAIFVAVLAYLQDQRVAARSEPAAVPSSPAQVILQLPPWPAASPVSPPPNPQ